MKQKLLLLGVVVFAGMVLSACGPKVEPSTPVEMNEQVESTETNNDVIGETMKEGKITVKANEFSYDVKEITVKKGEPVTITLVNEEGMHDLLIDEFNVKTKELGAGEEETITFTPDKAGTFEYYCSVGEHRKMGMVGKLIVEE